MRSLGLGATIIVLLAVTALLDEDTGVNNWLELRAGLARSTERVDRLVGQNASLRDEIELLETDPTAIDRVIREELDQALPGERVIRFQRVIESTQDDAAGG